MRDFWLTILAVLTLPCPALADGGLVCRTPIGWCATETSSPSQRCLCQHNGEPLSGLAALSGLENPLTRLEAAEEGDFRSIPALVTASRAFAGPDHYPPADFRAYGLVIFPRKASRFDVDRHQMFCEAYLSAMAHASDLSVPPEMQMVTVWPVSENRLAEEINALPADKACPPAIAHYGLLAAQNALEILKTYNGDAGRYDPYGSGPFLVAWTPGSGITKRETVAIVIDLSSVSEPEDAARQFSYWRDQIQNDPALWAKAPSKEALVDRLRRFFDRNGQILIGLGVQ